MQTEEQLKEIVRKSIVKLRYKTKKPICLLVVGLADALQRYTIL